MKRILMAAAIATAFTASPSMAASLSSASLSNFQVYLFDLDYNDGINSSINFQPTSYSNLNGSINKPGASQETTFRVAGDDISPVSKTITNSMNTASASISGDSLYNTVLKASGETLGTKGKENNERYLSIASNKIYFTITPNTYLSISADAQQYIETTDGTSDANEYALSWVTLSFYNDSGSTVSYYNSFIDSTGEYTAKEVNKSWNLSAIMENSSNQEYTGYFQSNILVYGTSNAEISKDNNLSEVPVPAALPLMASALGIFGLARRRNKSKAA